MSETGERILEYLNEPGRAFPVDRDELVEALFPDDWKIERRQSLAIARVTTALSQLRREGKVEFVNLGNVGNFFSVSKLL